MTEVRIILLSVAAMAAASLTGKAWSEPHQASYVFSGVIRAKAAATNILTVQTLHGPVDFHYRFPTQRQCAGYAELHVGDGVQVFAPVGNGSHEASCVRKVTPSGVSR